MQISLLKSRVSKLSDMAWDSRLGKSMHSGNDIPRSHHRLVMFGVLALVLGTLVMTAGKSLELDDKTSMELFLEGGARQHEILKSWDGHGVKFWAALLLLGDTLFLLVYTPFLITLSGRLWYEIKQDFGQTEYHFLWHLLPTFAILSSLILFILDLLENGLGIAAIIAGFSSNSIGILHTAKYIFIGLVCCFRDYSYSPGISLPSGNQLKRALLIGLMNVHDCV